MFILTVMNKLGNFYIFTYLQQHNLVQTRIRHIVMEVKKTYISLGYKLLNFKYAKRQIRVCTIPEYYANLP